MARPSTVTDGIESALVRAFDAADRRDVRLGGGVNTVCQCLRARLVNEMHIAVVPMLLGSDERVFEDTDAAALGYECVEFASSPAVSHVRLRRTVA